MSLTLPHLLLLPAVEIHIKKNYLARALLLAAIPMGTGKNLNHGATI
jgi:hypothetical protein